MRTLLVFAKEPRPGRVKTRLIPAIGPEGAARVYRAFVEDLVPRLSAVPSTRVEWWVEGAAAGLPEGAGPVRPQPPGDLGSRMEAAFREAFRAGGAPVAVVGTDCPLLTAPAVAALLDAVEAGADTAVIPAEDGGYAGLALGAPCPEAFSGIPWSTAGVLTATLERLRGAGRRTRVLPAVFDVDRPEDLERLARALGAAPSRAPATARVLEELRAGNGGAAGAQGRARQVKTPGSL